MSHQVRMLQEQVRDAEQRRAEAERQEREAKESLRLAQIAEAEHASLPPEPPMGSVIKFHVQFREDAPTYTYVASKINGPWYVTNTTVQYSWKKLVELMQKDFATKHLHGGRPNFYLYPNNGRERGQWSRHD